MRGRGTCRPMLEELIRDTETPPLGAALRDEISHGAPRPSQKRAPHRRRRRRLAIRRRPSPGPAGPRPRAGSTCAVAPHCPRSGRSRPDRRAPDVRAGGRWSPRRRWQGRAHAGGSHAIPALQGEAAERIDGPAAEEDWQRRQPRGGHLRRRRHSTSRRAMRTKATTASATVQATSTPPPAAGESACVTFDPASACAA